MGAAAVRASEAASLGSGWRLLLALLAGSLLSSTLVIFRLVQSRRNSPLSIVYAHWSVQGATLVFVGTTLAERPRWSAWAVLSGALLSVATLLVMPAIRRGGLARAATLVTGAASLGSAVLRAASTKAAKGGKGAMEGTHLAELGAGEGMHLAELGAGHALGGMSVRLTLLGAGETVELGASAVPRPDSIKAAAVPGEEEAEEGSAGGAGNGAAEEGSAGGAGNGAAAEGAATPDGTAPSAALSAPFGTALSASALEGLVVQVVTSSGAVLNGTVTNGTFLPHSVVSRDGAAGALARSPNATLIGATLVGASADSERDRTDLFGQTPLADLQGGADAVLLANASAVPLLANASASLPANSTLTLPAALAPATAPHRAALTLPIVLLALSIAVASRSAASFALAGGVKKERKRRRREAGRGRGAEGSGERGRADAAGAGGQRQALRQEEQGARRRWAAGAGGATEAAARAGGAAYSALSTDAEAPPEASAAQGDAVPQQDGQIGSSIAAANASAGDAAPAATPVAPAPAAPPFPAVLPGATTSVNASFSSPSPSSSPTSSRCLSSEAFRSRPISRLVEVGAEEKGIEGAQEAGTAGAGAAVGGAGPPPGAPAPVRVRQANDSCASLGAANSVEESGLTGSAPSSSFPSVAIPMPPEGARGGGPAPALAPSTTSPPLPNASSAPFPTSPLLAGSAVPQASSASPLLRIASPLLPPTARRSVLSRLFFATLPPLRFWMAPLFAILAGAALVAAARTLARAGPGATAPSALGRHSGTLLRLARLDLRGGISLLPCAALGAAFVIPVASQLWPRPDAPFARFGEATIAWPGLLGGVLLGMGCIVGLAAAEQPARSPTLPGGAGSLWNVWNSPSNPLRKLERYSAAREASAIAGLAAAVLATLVGAIRFREIKSFRAGVEVFVSTALLVAGVLTGFLP